MTPLSAFRSRIAPRVLTALDLTIDQAVLDTAIDFCEQSLILKETIDPLTTSAGQSTYDLSPALTDTSVCKVMRVWCQQWELEAVSEDDVSSPYGYANSVAGVTSVQSLPRTYHEPAPGQIALLPIPNGAYQLTIRAAVKPKRTAENVADVLYDNWAEEIVNGALSRLYAMPGMRFSNPQLAAVHAGMFRTGINRALVEASRGRTRAEMRVRPAFF